MVAPTGVCVISKFCENPNLSATEELKSPTAGGALCGGRPTLRALDPRKLLKKFDQNFRLVQLR